MKIIVAGSRTIVNYELVKLYISQSKFTIVEIVSGAANGVDRLGERYAKENKLGIKLFPANWNKYGKRAGYLRNEEMAAYADGAIIIHDGQSRGTQHMYNIMKQLDKPIEYHIGVN